MTNTEIIQAIRNEIERLKGVCTAQIKANPGQTFPFVMEMTGYDKLLSFLSTLELEKPVNQEDIDTEIGHWMDRLDDKYCLLVPHYSIQDIKDTARHFAEWGAEHLKK